MAASKSSQLRRIEREVEALAGSTLADSRRKQGYRAVPGKGNPEARIMLIGEAPGRQEALRGEPFVGAAGRLLDELLQSVGMKREQVFITNIVKDRPPENRDPRKNEIELYAPFLREQIRIIQPRVIVTLGRFAMSFVLAELHMPEQGQSITQLHGKPLRAKAPYGPVTVVPLFHPAVAFYRKDQQETLRTDFLALKKLGLSE